VIRALARLLAGLAPAAVIVVTAAATPMTELFINQGDVGLYLEKAGAVASGLLPYRDFPFEYPPLALVPMAVPYLTWPFGTVTLDVYRWLFAGWEAVLMLALGFVLLRIVRLGGDDGSSRDPLDRRLRRAATRLIPLSIAAALALTWRFDLFPALLVMVALWAALGGRAALAGFAIGLGVLAKLYPLAVVPALAIPWLFPLDVGRVTRYGVALTLTVGLVMLPLGLVAGSNAVGFLTYQAVRREVAAQGAVSPAMIVTLAAAAVLMLIATNKVFSIQYVVWIVPFVALLRGGRFWLALAVIGLTMPIHPLLYEGLVGQRALSILVLNLRNALFVALLAWTLWDIARDKGGTVARPAGLEPTTFRSAT
jgi:hypothetical protein